MYVQFMHFEISVVGIFCINLLIFTILNLLIVIFNINLMFSHGITVKF